MTDDETRRLRLRHVEAMRLFAEAKDVAAATETAIEAAPHSILAHTARALGQLALWMGEIIEADAREAARATYDPTPTEGHHTS
jgi:hypothetical protein